MVRVYQEVTGFQAAGAHPKLHQNQEEESQDPPKVCSKARQPQLRQRVLSDIYAQVRRAILVIHCSDTVECWR